MHLLIYSLLVGIGGFFGAIARFLVGRSCGFLLGDRFPYATMIVNLSGCLLLGWFATLAGERLIISEPRRLAIVSGFLGAYTTFSTLTYESNVLLAEGARVRAAVNLVGSLVLGMLALRIGIALARKF